MRLDVGERRLEERLVELLWTGAKTRGAGGGGGGGGGGRGVYVDGGAGGRGVVEGRVGEDWDLVWFGKGRRGCDGVRKDRWRGVGGGGDEGLVGLGSDARRLYGAAFGCCRSFHNVPGVYCVVV